MYLTKYVFICYMFVTIRKTNNNNNKNNNNNNFLIAQFMAGVRVPN